MVGLCLIKANTHKKTSKKQVTEAPGGMKIAPPNVKVKLSTFGLAVHTHTHKRQHKVWTITKWVEGPSVAVATILSN
jgi:hypothetical protein